MSKTAKEDLYEKFVDVSKQLSTLASLMIFKGDNGGPSLDDIGLIIHHYSEHLEKLAEELRRKPA